MPEKFNKCYPPETIYAFTTPQGLGGVMVLRLSGGEAKAVLERLTGTLPRVREMMLRSIRFEGETIDKALVVFFAAPNSWTGEDVVEFHLHASLAIGKKMVAICRAQGLRQATAGEFSKRAFLNGKADLTELEGLADLVTAETESQRKQALRQMEGASRKIVEDWRTRLLQILAQVEAQIDFSEDVKPAPALQLLKPLKNEIAKHLTHPYGERVRQGVRIALLGGANVGKSTLFNLLAGRQAAIISPQAGTTRDVLELALDIGGYAAVVYDMAGLRTNTDEIENEGVRRAEVLATEAELRVIILAPDVPRVENERAMAFHQKGDVVLVNKIDQLGNKFVGKGENQEGIKVSLTHLGSGFDDFNEKLTNRIGELCGSAATPSLLTRERHRDALTLCYDSLERATSEALSSELQAEELRQAATSLGRITGAVDVEDMLDQLFAEFCIGK